ncbi:4Fe-4S binding protein [Eggerthella sinensis]|uniref:4Fe-4S binding protein n=1 Tax=Eggerthella sinensis TaxID=242230 RepID=UPI00248E00E2|nr:4Fe-4S binding protein [Eggerthella sinensis]
MEQVPRTDDIDAGYCLRFLREVRDVAFATTDEAGLPAVRIIDVMMVEGGRLYFVAARGKAFYADVMRTRFVAIVGQSPDFRTCRLRGAVEHPDDEAEQHRLVDRIFELNPSMQELYPGDSRYVLEAFYLQDAQGEYFDLSGTPIVRVPFALGSAREAVAGFVITDRCVGCGTCAEACPEQCIAAGSPYEIAQVHCLRCGRCAEVCPHDAIERRS